MSASYSNLKTKILKLEWNFHIFFKPSCANLQAAKNKVHTKDTIHRPEFEKRMIYHKIQWQSSAFSRKILEILLVKFDPFKKIIWIQRKTRNDKNYLKISTKFISRKHSEKTVYRTEFVETNFSRKFCISVRTPAVNGITLSPSPFIAEISNLHVDSYSENTIQK